MRQPKILSNAHNCVCIGKEENLFIYALCVCVYTHTHTLTQKCLPLNMCVGLSTQQVAGLQMNGFQSYLKKNIF